MIEIPQNSQTDDFEAKVDKAIRAVLNDKRFDATKNSYSDVLQMNHAIVDKSRGEIKISEKVAEEVARRFKAKGYFAHYCTSIYGRPYTLTITTYPTDNDI